jgi:FkbM family methyltransferase
MKNFFKDLLPYGLVRKRRDRLACKRLGLDPSMAEDLLRAVEICRYDLWPDEIRRTDDFYLVDVGANKGQFTTAVLMLQPLAQVLTIEPQPGCCALLRQKLAKLPNVELKECAVGRTNGLVTFNVFTDDVASSVLNPAVDIQNHYAGSGMKVAQHIQVELQTLDSLIPTGREVSLLKVDVQGYEDQVLAGATDILKRTTCVMLEVNYEHHYEGESDFTCLHQIMVSHGFRLHGVSAPYFSEAQPLPLWADALYVRLQPVTSRLKSILPGNV